MYRIALQQIKVSTHSTAKLVAKRLQANFDPILSAKYQKAYNIVR